MNTDQFKGKANQFKGQIKEAAGKFFGIQRLENKGKAQDAAGDLQEGVGDLKDDIKKGH